MDIDKTIRKYVLQNAIKFGGKANPGAVVGKVIAEHPEVKSDMKNISSKINETIKSISKLSVEQMKDELKNLAPQLLEKKEYAKRTGLPELKNVKGEVVMRIAPYPSGPLQLGNAKQLILNDEYVKKYGGKFLVVIDDTIGSEEKNISPEAYDMIVNDIHWLKCKITKPILTKSERMEIYYDYAFELIRKDKAYVCFCDAETLRSNREKGIECEHRHQKPSETEKRFKEMLDGVYDEGKAVLRLKTDMKHKDPAFRDRVLFRVCKRPHPKVGNKYLVWPLLEFSWAIDDHVLGMTHIMRGKDLIMESNMEKYIWDIFGWKHPEIIHTGMMMIEGIKISKSKSKKEVLSGEYIGWDDPRTWSIMSLKRRGILPEAIRNFIISAGVTQNDVTVPIESLYNENKKILDPLVNRYFFIKEPKEIKIIKAPEQEIYLDLHPNHPERGKRAFKVHEHFYIEHSDFQHLKKGKLYRLMDCLNFKKENEHFAFDSVEYENYKERGDRIMHWLPESDDLVKVEILMEESNLRNVKPGETIQFERFGFVRLDSIEKGIYKFWWTHN